MHTEAEHTIIDPGHKDANIHGLDVSLKLDATDAIAAVRTEMETLAGEAPAEEMTIEEAQKRLLAMVKQRDNLDAGIKAYKKYITKKIASL